MEVIREMSCHAGSLFLNLRIINLSLSEVNFNFHYLVIGGPEHSTAGLTGYGHDFPSQNAAAA